MVYIILVSSPSCCGHYLLAALVVAESGTTVFEFDIMLLSSLLNIYIYKHGKTCCCNLHHNVMQHQSVMACHCHDMPLCHDVLLTVMTGYVSAL